MSANTITVIDIIFEDFINYKKACMTIEMPYCDFKCNKDCGKNVCQNFELLNSKTISIDIDDLIERYLSNPITHSVCFQGLEPFYKESYKEVYNLINTLRVKYNCNDDIIIYTGYTEEECIKYGYIKPLMQLSDNNIIIKYGRFIPGHDPHLDDILKVKLSSDNQYAKII